MAIVLAMAFFLDAFFGELPERFHPIVWLGTVSNFLEQKMNVFRHRPYISIVWGGVAMCLVACVFGLAASILFLYLPVFWFEVLMLYVCVGWRSLLEHVWCFREMLVSGDIMAIRKQAACLVGRDLRSANESDCIRAVCESLVENFGDAVFASVFWYVLGGVWMLLIHRLINTLDAMWGYKNQRFLYFGRTVALLDDVLNYIPARLLLWVYLVAGNFAAGFRSVQNHAAAWESPNAGLLIAGAAGSFGVPMGGVAHYGEKVVMHPFVGPCRAATLFDLDCLLGKVYVSFLWCVFFVVCFLILGWLL